MGKYALRVPIVTTIQIGNSKRIDINFDRMSFQWVNGSEEFYPEAVIPISCSFHELSDYSWPESMELRKLNHFLSILAANSHQPIQIHKSHRYIVHSDGHWEQLSRRILPFILTLEEIPLESVHSEREKLVLSLYREAITTSSIFYSFLSFYKILELGHDNCSQSLKSSRIKAYIDDNIDVAIANSPPSPHCRFLSPSNPTGHELYKVYRCAIAHASERDMLSPDDAVDYYATLARIDFIRALAAHMINSGHFTSRA